MDDFRKYATKHLGMNSLVLDDVKNSQTKKNGVAEGAGAPVKELQIYQLDALFAPSVKHKKGTKDNAAIKQLLNQ